MSKLVPKPQSSPAHRQVTTPTVAVRRSGATFRPHFQCTCHADDDRVGQTVCPLHADSYSPLDPRNGITSYHLPIDPQLRDAPSKTSKKRGRPGRPRSELQEKLVIEVQEELISELQKERNRSKVKAKARRQQRDAMRIREADARLEDIKNVGRPALALQEEPISEFHEEPISELQKERNKSKAKAKARRQQREAMRIREADAQLEGMKAVKPVLGPHAQCYCYDELSDSEDEANREALRIIRHKHIDGSTICHLPSCLTIRSDYVTPGQLLIKPTEPASYIDLEEEQGMTQVRKKRKYTRRQPKAAKVLHEIPEPNAKPEAVKPMSDPYAICLCDEYETDGESLTRTRRVMHEDGTESHHLASCAEFVTLPETSRKTQEKTVKSAAYIDLEAEGNEEGTEPTSPPAIQYDSRTIASDFLRAIGKHPHLPPLNGHMEGFSAKRQVRASN